MHCICYKVDLYKANAKFKAPANNSLEELRNSLDQSLELDEFWALVTELHELLWLRTLKLFV